MILYFVTECSKLSRAWHHVSRITKCTYIDEIHPCNNAMPYSTHFYMCFSFMQCWMWHLCWASCAQYRTHVGWWHRQEPWSLWQKTLSSLPPSSRHWPMSRLWSKFNFRIVLIKLTFNRVFQTSKLQSDHMTHHGTQMSYELWRNKWCTARN